MSEKHLGKINSVGFGIGGYDGRMFGLSVDLRFDGASGVCDFKGTWCPGIIDVTDNTKWTEEDRSRQLDELARFVAKLLVESKRDDVSRLAGVPVEVEMEGQMLKSWRVLTEVI